MDVKGSNPDGVWNGNGFASASTVRNHIDNIYQKLGVRNRLELANLIGKDAQKKNSRNGSSGSPARSGTAPHGTNVLSPKIGYLSTDSERFPCI